MGMSKKEQISYEWWEQNIKPSLFFLMADTNRDKTSKKRLMNCKDPLGRLTSIEAQSNQS